MTKKPRPNREDAASAAGNARLVGECEMREIAAEKTLNRSLERGLEGAAKRRGSSGASLLISSDG